MIEKGPGEGLNMNDFGKTKEVLIKVKELFQQLLFILETEGDFEVNYAKTELAKNIRVLEGFLGEKMDAAAAQEVLDHIKKSFKSMYPPRGGLSDFFVEACAYLYDTLINLWQEMELAKDNEGLE